MEKFDTLSWKSKDDLKLFGIKYNVENPEAIVCLVHGMGEHCERYHHLAKFFAGNNIATLMYDLRGHGKSEGNKGHTPSYAMLMYDIEKLLESKDKFFDQNIPTFLYGHSFGGNIVSNYVLAYHPKIAGSIITSSLFEVAFKAPKWKTTLGRIMNNIYGEYTDSSGLNAAHISRIESEVEKYKADPLIHDKVSARMFVEFTDAGNWALENAQKLKTPMLVMHGDADKITAFKASETFANNAGNLAHFKSWEGGYHELQNDLGQEQVFNYTLAWMNEQLN